MAAVGHGKDHQPEPTKDATPHRGWPIGTRMLLAAAAVVLTLGAAAVAVIIADPHRLGMSYSSAPDDARPDNVRPDGTRPDGTFPDHARPGGGPGGEGTARLPGG